MSTRGNTSAAVALALAIVVVASAVLGINIPHEATQWTIDQCTTIIRERGYEICENVKFEQIKVAGLRIAEKGWEVFLQICDRFVVSLGNLKVYLDLEARVMFVYSSPADASDVYYVQF